MVRGGVFDRVLSSRPAQVAWSARPWCEAAYSTVCCGYDPAPPTRPSLQLPGAAFPLTSAEPGEDRGVKQGPSLPGH